jgi:hypothetical protein
MPRYWTLDTDEQNRMFQAHVSMMRLAGKPVKVEFCNEEPKQRTPTQNRCMHQWHSECAVALNDAGFDLKQVLREDAEIPVTATNFMENIWRPVQVAMTGKTSSTKPTTIEYQQIFEVIVRHVASTLGIKLPPWPSYHNEGDKT